MAEPKKDNPKPAPKPPPPPPAKRADVDRFSSKHDPSRMTTDRKGSHDHG